MICARSTRNKFAGDFSLFSIDFELREMFNFLKE